MKVLLRTEIDCDGMPMTAGVEADVTNGDDSLAMSLYDAMAVACRLLASAARDDQLRTHTEQAAK